MGYSVYWANGRWQGYGVIAYCDYPKCKEIINRGMGCQHDSDQMEPPSIFCCKTHKYYGLPEDYEPEEKEHPEWIEHILDHLSWEEWRNENPEIVERYKKYLIKP